MWKYSFDVLNKLVDSVVHSGLWANVFKAGLAALAFTAGIHVYIYCVFGLVIIDVVTGVMASLKKGEQFKSRILRRGLIEKSILYILLMISVFILEIVIKTAINYSAFYLVLIATVLISTYELSSIFENLLVINPNIGFLKGLIRLSNKLQNKTIDIAEKKIDSIDDLIK